MHLVDRYFNRALDAAERELGAAIAGAKRAAEIDRLLTDETSRRAQAHLRRVVPHATVPSSGARANGKGWDGRTTRTLEPDPPLLAPLAAGRAVRDRR